MSFVDPGSSVSAASSAANDLSNTLDLIQTKTDKLKLDVGGFAGAMTHAFTQAVRGGKQFDDVLKSLALKLSELAVKSALKSVAGGLSGSLSSVLNGVFGSGGTGGRISLNAMGAIKPFAAGGVIGAPTYFPLSNGGLGLAGEAGPEAIVPLTRGADGRLGVAMSGQAAPNVTVHINTPDVSSFHRSEAYITGQIARAVARGQRSL
ncbi:MAG: phage tail tape measure protein [Pseudolabrys sp.]